MSKAYVVKAGYGCGLLVQALSRGGNAVIVLTAFDGGRAVHLILWADEIRRLKESLEDVLGEGGDERGG